MIAPEQKQKAIRMYRNKSLTIAEIANLTDISVPQLTKMFRDAFEMGLLKPRRTDFALKNRVPNGQGKSKYIPKGTKTHSPNFHPKYTEEEQEQIAVDYYVNNLSVSQLKQKYSIHPMQLQVIRNKFSDIYGKKEGTRAIPVLQYSRSGELLAEFESESLASKATCIPNSNISRCCKGQRASAGGFVWKYKQLD